MVRCTSCGQELAADERFCGNCGTPRPVAPEPPRVKPAAARRLDPRFEQAEREFFALKSKLDRGRIARGEFDAALEKLMLQDAQGRYWMLGADSGKWYVHDGRVWVQAEPSPAEAGQAPRSGAEQVSATYGAEAGAIARPTVPTGIAGSYRFAGFWRRLVASLVDGLVVWGLGSVLLFPFRTSIQLGSSSLEGEPALSMTTIAVYALLGLIGVVYYLGFWTWRGQTPGKMVLGMKIVKTDGTPLTFGRALVRYIGYLTSGIVLCLGYLWVGLDSRKQGWHDKIAGTYVVRV